MSLIGISRKKDKAKAKAAAPLPVEVAPDEVYITPLAAEHIPPRAVEEGVPGGLLRVGVMGGGCSGLSYVFRFENDAKESDARFERDGAHVIVDPKSLTVLGGMILDWDTALGRSGFLVKNPNAKSTCSCGESFSV